MFLKLKINEPRMKRIIYFSRLPIIGPIHSESIFYLNNIPDRKFQHVITLLILVFQLSVHFAISPHRMYIVIRIRMYLFQVQMWINWKISLMSCRRISALIEKFYLMNVVAKMYVYDSITIHFVFSKFIYINESYTTYTQHTGWTVCVCD